VEITQSRSKGKLGFSSLVVTGHEDNFKAARFISVKDKTCPMVSVAYFLVGMNKVSPYV
jgi:hypothetical protein